MEKTLGQIAYEAYWTQKDSGWNTQSDYQKEYYEKIAAATVAAYKKRMWQLMDTAPIDGFTNILAAGKYTYPRDPQFNPTVVAQVYYNRLMQEWLDTQGHRFSPAMWMDVPVSSDITLGVVEDE